MLLLRYHCNELINTRTSKPKLNQMLDRVRQGENIVRTAQYLSFNHRNKL